MAQQFSAEWARGIIDGGIQKAQGIIDDPSQIDSLLQQLQDKLQTVPGTVANAFGNVPLMAQMVKSYVTREYTEVSPKVVISLVSAFLYLVKKDDLIPDNVPILGMADDVAVAAIAMAINEPELKAFAQWREQNMPGTKAMVQEAAPAVAEAPVVQEYADQATDVIVEDEAPAEESAGETA